MKKNCTVDRRSQGSGQQPSEQFGLETTESNLITDRSNATLAASKNNDISIRLLLPNKDNSQHDDENARGSEVTNHPPSPTTQHYEFLRTPPALVNAFRKARLKSHPAATPYSPVFKGGKWIENAKTSIFNSFSNPVAFSTPFVPPKTG